MIGRNDPCWCGSGKKYKKCCYPTPAPGQEREQFQAQYGILLKSEEQIAGIRRACKLAAQVLRDTCAQAKEGVPTEELNRFAHQQMVEAGATPAALHYGSPPYPKSICISLNEVICHGISDDRPLQAGDIANIDVACILDGYYGDCSGMITIGQISEEAQRVVDVSRECLDRAIAILKPGIEVREIGEAIESYATSKNCSVVRDFVGHGVGVNFHEPPQIPHCRNQVAIPLAAGMTFTIEPMINAGVIEGWIDPDDGWTVRTQDGKPSAQWEHTLLITETGHEILTLP
jgi:methionyl aminopeptidase